MADAGSSYDVVVYGSGLSAMAAALVLAERGRRVGFVESMWSIDIQSMAIVDPSLRWPTAQSGWALWWDWHERFVALGGTSFADSIVEPGAITAEGGRFVLRDFTGELVGSGERLVFAPQAAQPFPTVDGVNELWGKGLSQCALSDAPFFSTETVVVAGNGDYALHHALLAAGSDCRVILLLHDASFHQASLHRAVATERRIQGVHDARVLALHTDGNGHLSEIDVDVAGKRTTIACRALFPLDDPTIATEVEAAHSPLVQQSREANVALATAGVLNGVPWFEHAALVADGIQAAQSLLESEQRTSGT